MIKRYLFPSLYCRQLFLRPVINTSVFFYLGRLIEGLKEIFIISVHALRRLFPFSQKVFLSNRIICKIHGLTVNTESVGYSHAVYKPEERRHGKVFGKLFRKFEIGLHVPILCMDTYPAAIVLYRIIKLAPVYLKLLREQFLVSLLHV